MTDRVYTDPGWEYLAGLKPPKSTDYAAIAKIEAAAKAEGAREAVAEIWQRFSADSPTLRDFSVWLASKHHAGLDNERESSLGRDTEGHLVLTLGPGAESPSRKPDTITGYVDPSGKGEENWSELNGLSPLEQYNREGR